MSTITKKSYEEQLSDDLNEWIKSHPESEQLDKDEIASWLIKERGYHLERQRLHKQIAKKVARLLGKREVKTDHGKWVSEFHAATFAVPGKKVQKTLWSHRLKMTESFAHTSFEQRQKKVEGICRAMHNDAEDVNANNPNLAKNPVQLDFNFSYVQGQSEAPKVQTLPILPPGAAKKGPPKKPK
jgi:hypothetical protein